VADLSGTLDSAARAARLSAARDIGHIALSAITPIRVNEGPAVLGKITRLNADVVRDDVLERTLAASHSNLFAKLLAVATRMAEVAAEIESHELPVGWSIRETIHQRTYYAAGGSAEVTVNKDFGDPGRLDIKLYGQRVWSGYEGESPGHVPLLTALRKAEEVLKVPTLNPHRLDGFAALRHQYKDAQLVTSPSVSTHALAALRAIRAHDARLDGLEQAPTGDDYNCILALALEALGTLENPQLLPDSPQHHSDIPSQTWVQQGVLESLRELALAWQADAERYRRFLPGKRVIVLDRYGRAFAHLDDDNTPRFKLERPYPGLFGISLMDRETAVAARSELETHAPEFGPFVPIDVLRYAESKVRQACELFEQLEHTGGQHPTPTAGSQPPAGPNPEALATSSDNHTRDVLKAAENRSLGITSGTMTPAEDTITFRVWHDEDATRGLAPERAKVELEIGDCAASQRVAYIEEARTSLRNLFSTLWSAPATVLTEQELAEAAGEAEAPQP
jgi:hypothetical protein